MNSNMTGILVIFGGYLLGSVPWALVIGKVFFNTDVREHGSGNLGATNVGRTLGKKAGITVMILDGLKAFITVWFCAVWFPEWTVFAGLACCVGHCFPVFAGFRGGKAVATSFGYFLGIGLFVTHNPLATFGFPLLVMIIVLYITKLVSLSSMIAISCGAIFSFFTTSDIRISLSFVALSIFVIYRHKSNIHKIINGEEKKITWI